MTGGAAAAYARRRARVLDALGEDAVLVLPAAPEPRVGRDLELRYRPDPDLYYLTGYPEPEAVLVLGPVGGEAPYTLFVRPRDPEQELWTGVRGGTDAAVETYGADAAYPLAELGERLPSLLAGVETIYFPQDRDDAPAIRLVRHALADARRRRQRTGTGPRAAVDPGAILDEMRLVKDADELELLRDAARITAESFEEAAALIRPGVGEWEIEAAIEAGFRRRGAEGFGFPSIVASGPNATVLHYRENARTLRAGELLLIDAGARHRMYNGDVSRTFPVSGRFTAAQRDLYDAVLAAHDRAIEGVRPGATIARIHQIALRTLVDALVTIGLLDGSVDALVEEEAYRPYIAHQTSHWLGLDVHDVGDYAVRGGPRELAPGMVLTVEPGLYIPEDDERAPAELRGTGIRIEDDVAVTEQGHEILTATLSAGAAEIEALLPGTT